MPPIAKLPIKDSKVYHQCSTVYKAMFKYSAETELNGEKVRLWTGPITSFFNICGVPQGSYQKVRNQLVDLGCMTITTEGRVGTPTVVVLHFDPESVEWPEPERKHRLTRRGEAAMLRQQAADLAMSLGGLDVKAALIDLQEQITQLKQKIALIEKERTVGSTEKAKTSTTSTGNTRSRKRNT